jgi:hypothetical protein
MTTLSIQPTVYRFTETGAAYFQELGYDFIPDEPVLKEELQDVAQTHPEILEVGTKFVFAFGDLAYLSEAWF